MEHIAHVWPSMADLAADIGKPYSTVAAWKQRGRIPADYDFILIEAAKRRGKTLTLEELAMARAGHVQFKTPSSAPASPSTREVS